MIDEEQNEPKKFNKKKDIANRVGAEQIGRRRNKQTMDETNRKRNETDISKQNRQKRNELLLLRLNR